MGSLSFSWSKDHVYLHAKQVGNWSRWLTDLFGIDDNDSLEDLNKHDSNKIECDTSLKAFHLLNTLSDLMMLPFEMLADSSARKEVKHWAEFFLFYTYPRWHFPYYLFKYHHLKVCPIFGTRIIKRVLNNFVPDEFNPDPIPEAVFKSLDSEVSPFLRLHFPQNCSFPVC